MFHMSMSVDNMVSDPSVQYLGNIAKIKLIYDHHCLLIIPRVIL